MLTYNTKLIKMEFKIIESRTLLSQERRFAKGAFVELNVKTQERARGAVAAPSSGAVFTQNNYVVTRRNVNLCFQQQINSCRASENWLAGPHSVFI